jgi:hypothetical protein
LSNEELTAWLEQAVQETARAGGAASSISDGLQAHRSFTERHDEVGLVAGARCVRLTM